MYLNKMYVRTDIMDQMHENLGHDTPANLYERLHLLIRPPLLHTYIQPVSAIKGAYYAQSL